MIGFIFETILVVVKCFYFTVEAAFMFLISPFYVPQKSVRGEIVLVTGAGSGIGRLMTLKFADLGARVVLLDVNKDSIDKVAAEVKAKGQEAHAYECNLCNKDEIYKTATVIKKDVGDVTILVNNAGVVTGKKFLDLPDDKVDLTFKVNTSAHFWTIRAFLPAMKAKNHGHIVTIASGAGLFGIGGLVDYCASKFGAVGTHEALTVELNSEGLDGVHTTCVCPYYINTGMFDGVTTKFPALLPILESEYAVKRIMTAVLCNQKLLMMPAMLWLMYALKGLLPDKVTLLLEGYFELTKGITMNFKGRVKQD